MIKNMINTINVINDTVENNKKPKINKEEVDKDKNKTRKNLNKK